MASSECVAQLMERMRAAWPHWKPRRDTPAEYLRVLGPVPDDLLVAAYRAVERLPREYPPPPGVLYDAARKLADPLPSGAEAWALACRAGRGEAVALPGPVRKALAVVGGPSELGRQPEESLGVHRARFLEAYREEAERAAWQSAAVGLLGEGGQE
jgi:hypothetical protein